MAAGILSLMKEHTKTKDRDQEKHKYIQENIQTEIQRAKEAWTLETCPEIEDIEQKHDSLNMHGKAKEVSGIYETPRVSRLLNEKTMQS